MADNYIDKLINLLYENFQERLQYVGLQGSYLRGEADENSDIDIMVIIDEICIGDLEAYKNILIENGNYDKCCGFICGKSEMNSWNPLEICHLIHTTKDYYGKLENFIPTYTDEDEKNFIKLSLDNLYHELCHCYIYSNKENNIAALPAAYKKAFFIIQNLYYHNTGIFVNTKHELINCVQNDEKVILEAAEILKSNDYYSYDDAFKLLFEWCQKTIILV